MLGICVSVHMEVGEKPLALCLRVSQDLGVLGFVFVSRVAVDMTCGFQRV